MRPRHQSGQVVKRNGMWLLRYYEDRLVDGEVKRVRACKTLAPVAAYRTETEVRRELADPILASVNGRSGGQDAAMTLGEFVETRHFPHLEQRLSASGELHLEPSTLKGYRDIFKFHVRGKPVAKVRLRDFRTADGQLFLESLPQRLSHQTHLRVKAFLSGVFSRALQAGAITGANPMDNTKAGGAKKNFEGHAYSLDEISVMLEELPEPARTVCAVAAFTGLSASELRGLRWQDYDGDMLRVEQKVWGRHVGQPKTEARRGAVPVIPALRKILEEYRKVFPPNGTDFIFRGDKKGFALDLNNLSRRVIAPALNGGWHGWHAFRRGLGTRLFYLGTDAKTVQTILRHANVSTTLGHYIVAESGEVQAAMKKFSRVLDSNRPHKRRKTARKPSKGPVAQR